MIGIVSGVFVSLVISMFGGSGKVIQEPPQRPSYQQYRLPSIGNDDISKPMEALGGGFKNHKR